MDRDKLSKLLLNTYRNAILSWVILSILVFLTFVDFMNGRYTWGILSSFAICIILLPAVFFKNLSIMPPWYLLMLVALPIVGNAIDYQLFSSSIPHYISVATIALLLAAEINWFTSVKMDHKFAILFVFITTLAISGLWYLMQWLLDTHIGTSFILDGRSKEAVNTAVMYEFMYATVSGIVAGLIFGWYFRSRGGSTPSIVRFPSKDEQDVPAYTSARPPEPIRKLLSISKKKLELATRVMQACLLIMMFVGIYLKDTHVVLNAIIVLGITFVPIVLTHKYYISLDPSLALWITLAVFLHTLGTVSFYETVARWDNLTHALSASVIAAAGYVVIRAIDIYTDDLYIPPRFMFVFILLFVLAAGVIWEILEFLTDEMVAKFEMDAFLTQHGIDDTMRDMFFDLLGALVVAAWGAAYLSDMSYRLARRIETFSAFGNEK
jgi:hypothetical protein